MHNSLYITNHNPAKTDPAANRALSVSTSDDFVARRLFPRSGFRRCDSKCETKRPELDSESQESLVS